MLIKLHTVVTKYVSSTNLRIELKKVRSYASFALLLIRGQFSDDFCTRIIPSMNTGNKMGTKMSDPMFYANKLDSYPKMSKFISKGSVSCILNHSTS